MDVSVVIPTYNREELLRKSTPEYANQDAGGFSYEVIFVINGSTDNSEAVLKEATRRWPDKIRYLVIPPSGSPAAPRNAGIRAAKGNAVVIVDDDVIPDRRFVFHHAEFHRTHPAPTFAAIGELTIPEGSLDDPESFFHEFISYDRFRGKDRLHFLDFWTCNVSVKRQFMLEHGMFDESLLYFEDGLCGYRLACNGMQLCFVPEAKGLHVHHINLNGIGAKGQLIGRTLYRFEQMVPDRELRRRYGILNKDIGPKGYASRVLNRVLLYSLSNPVFMAGLKPIATSSRKRSRITDAYYYLLFRRSILSAYGKARREAKRRSQTQHS
ncbi:MAG TPA: glycosyltransferase family A protein [Terriglobales bacterium]|nr:glycosyltransferase family A protein [Terriglobales bacterium]